MKATFLQTVQTAYEVHQCNLESIYKYFLQVLYYPQKTDRN